jgi:hypothetical protein
LATVDEAHLEEAEEHHEGVAHPVEEDEVEANQAQKAGRKS